MGCEERRADLVAYLYGELGGKERAALMDHVASCADCEGELVDIAAASSAVRAMREREEPWKAGAASMGDPDTPGVPRAGLLDALRNWWGGAVAMPRWGYAGALAAGLALLVVATRLDVARSGRSVTVAWGRGSTTATPVTTTPAAGGDLASAKQGSNEAPGAALTSGETQESALLAEVSRMLAESEKRQTAATAQLVDGLGANYARQLETARRQDLQLVDYWIGNLSGKTQMEFSRTNQQLAQMADLILASQGNGGAWPGSRGVPATREGRLEPGVTGDTLSPQPKNGSGQ